MTDTQVRLPQDIDLDNTDPTTRRRARPSLLNIVLFIIMCFWGLLTFGPLLWMLVNSLRSSEQIVTQPIGPPDLSKITNYAEAWEQADLGTSLVNSLIVSVGAVILSGLCALLIGFALSRGGLPFSNVLLTFFMIGLLIPALSSLLPLLLQLQASGLTSTRTGLIIAYAGGQLSLGVFLFKIAFDAIPKEYIEAALLDGAGVPRILWSIMMPMVRPTIATFAILAFIAVYNDFVFTLVLNNDPALYTLPVSLLQFSSVYGTRYDLIFASVAIATIPPLIGYILLRKQVQSSMAAGGRTG